MRINKGFIAVTSIVAAVLVGGGIAFATWSVTGSGTGSGAGTIAQSLTVIPETPTGVNASLYPGGPASAVYFEITNPNSFAVTITSVAWGAATSTNTASCASSNISIDASAPTTVSIPIPAATTTAVLSIPGVLDLSHSAGPGCQAVAFDAVMTVTGAQQ